MNIRNFWAIHQVVKVFVLFLLLTIVTGSGPSRVRAQEPPDSGTIQLKVDGLICPFCTFNVEKQLREVPGVQSVSTELETGWVTVIPEKDRKPSPAALWDAVVRGGFTPRLLRMGGQEFDARPARKN